MEHSLNNLKIRNITRVALCLTLLIVSSYLIIPIPFTPIVLSLHTVMINIIALLFSPVQALKTLLIYTFMGLIGLPVFSGGTSGPVKLFGITGGYYFGFIISVYFISKYKGKEINFLRYCFITICLGIPIQHLCAIFQMSLYNHFNILNSFFTVSLPFIITDILKCILASYITINLNKTLKVIK